MRNLMADLVRRIEADLTGDGRLALSSKAREPFVPCPIGIGNDPCDDWSEDENDDYDY